MLRERLTGTGDACFTSRATTPPSLSLPKIKEHASQAKEEQDQENAAQAMPGVRNEIIENFQRSAFGGMQEETGRVSAMMVGTLNEESMRQSICDTHALRFCPLLCLVGFEEKNRALVASWERK